MDREQLRRADFKTGILLIAFCLWFLSITFIFMPFKETYGGVENVWYVSPWIFPAVVLTLLLLLSIILTVNAVLHRGHRDVVEFGGGFRLTGIGTVMNTALVIGSAVGLWYLIVNIEEKIAFTIAEAKWLADPSKANIFSWWDPFSVVSLTGTALVLLASVWVLAVSTARRRRHGAPQPVSGEGNGPSEALIRFAVIAVLFAELVYVLIPNVDFFVGIVLFLAVFTVTFHVDDTTVARRSMGVYLAVGTAALLVFATGLDGFVNAGYKWTSDLVILAVTVGYMVWGWRFLGHDPRARRAYRTCLVISWVVPSILAPVFRFGLLVPLPHEGAVIGLMHEIRYLF